MAISIYDLAGAEDNRLFSPYCWRIKMALAHKGLDYETIPWRFTETEAIAFSGCKTVPVIVDGERSVGDSWAIAEYLDAQYPDKPALFEGAQARALAFFFKHWVERSVHLPLFRVILMDLYGHLHEKDKTYFRTSREKRFGVTLEQFSADPKASLAALRTALDAARQAVLVHPYLSGTTPGFADYILFGAFQWARVMSPTRLLEPDDPMYAWRERLLDAHGGLARQAKGYPVWA